ncbi:metallophosphoesterase [Chitinimonas sp.]|uniref:metallophosphoesterase family protein n=1 Tax=Chitinimonas sp. TaxID=1934313 RepID=UPI0035AE1CE2
MPGELRIAVLSDIHGNLAALEAVIADIRRHGVDAVINLGDSLSGPLLPLQTAQCLMAQDWTHLAGNHERQILELNERSAASDQFAHAQLGEHELSWIASLRPALQWREQVFACHGTPHSDVLSLLENADRPARPEEIEARLGGVQAELLLCGHTHVPRSVRSRSGMLIVNPGSVGHPAYLDDYPYPHAIESGSPDARYALIDYRAGHWHSQLLNVPYDPAPMAQLALKQQRPDWAQALLTGYVT